MRHLRFSLVIGLFAASAIAGGATENVIPRHADTYGSDNKWWKCDALNPARGCETGTFSSLGLSPEEESFVREKLDRISWSPIRADKEAVSKVMGKKPTIDVGLKQIYQGIGVGADPNRGVSVYYLNGYVSMIHWFQPGRFLLVKARSS